VLREPLLPAVIGREDDLGVIGGAELVSETQQLRPEFAIVVATTRKAPAETINRIRRTVVTDE